MGKKKKERRKVSAGRGNRHHIVKKKEKEFDPYYFADKRLLVSWEELCRPKGEEIDRAS